MCRERLPHKISPSISITLRFQAVDLSLPDVGVGGSNGVSPLIVVGMFAVEEDAGAGPSKRRKLRILRIS